MKRISCLIALAWLGVWLLTACKDNHGGFGSSADPEIELPSDQLYAAPNRNFLIKALLKDDLGLKSVDISIPEFHLNKAITFPTDSLVISYNLSYEFLVPGDFNPSDRFSMTLVLTDVSGNQTSKSVDLRLDGDFIAPALANFSPTANQVLFSSDNLTMNVRFDAADPSGLSYVVVQIEELELRDSIPLNGELQYSFDKAYPLPAGSASYSLEVRVGDRFVAPNTAVRTVPVLVAESLPALYLVDVPPSTNLQTDVCGIPMYFHQQLQNAFVFKYYADADDKEIRFLGQSAAFAPHCFGLDADGRLINSVESEPILLPHRGYYRITVDIAAGSVVAEPYTPVSKPMNVGAIPLTICGNGMVGGGWDPSNKDFLLIPNPANPYELSTEMELSGAGLAITVTGPGWNPFWRLDVEGVAPFNGGGNATYDAGLTGRFKMVLDTELERLKLIPLN